MTGPQFIKPMEARLASDLPAGEGRRFEPKWDGFRCLEPGTMTPVQEPNAWAVQQFTQRDLF